MGYSICVEVFDEWGDDVFPQARFIVRGYDDVLWTDDLQAATQYVKSELERMKDIFPPKVSNVGGDNE